MLCCTTYREREWSLTSSARSAPVGLDVSAPMLQEARRRRSKSCLLTDARALPFGDAVFDLVALIATLEFISEPARALDEAVRVARQGLLVGTLNRWSLYALRRRLRSSPLFWTARGSTPPPERRRNPRSRHLVAVHVMDHPLFGKAPGHPVRRLHRHGPDAEGATMKDVPHRPRQCRGGIGAVISCRKLRNTTTSTSCRPTTRRTVP